MTSTPQKTAPHRGKLAVLMPGLGAVATTFMAGAMLVRRGKSSPVGSLTQLGQIETSGEHKGAPVRELVDLAPLEDLVFGGWDIYEESTYEAAKRANVLSPAHLEEAREELEQISPMPAVFDQRYVRNLEGPNVKKAGNKMALAEALVADIGNFIANNGCDRAVGVWCGSTEVFVQPSRVHMDLDAFERGLKENDDAISPAMLYAYAFARAGVPLANGAPNLALDVPAIQQLAREQGVAIAGKDFKTGQTLMKTILAPGFATRYLGVRGWYSTNILGNLDGVVLDDPGSFKTKEASKLSVLESILDGEANPQLYGELDHKVRIDYYPPRGDNKEGWDNIDIFGWMGYPMQIKVNFLCRDSILAAPIVLDLALLLDLAQRGGKSGVQEWLSFYFKSPQTSEGGLPEHDLFEQRRMLEQTLLELRRS